MTEREKAFEELNEFFQVIGWDTDDIMNFLMDRMSTKEIKKIIKELRADKYESTL